MKQSLFKILLFFVLFCFIDQISRPLLMSLMAHAKTSALKNTWDMANLRHDDIVVLGSSRAMHHYDSRIIEDSTNMSCMNFGAMSNGIVLMYGRYKLLTKNHTPKLIIYDIHPPFDVEIGDNTKYIPSLRPYADNIDIQNLFNRIDCRENLKNHSTFYRFNSLLPELLSTQFSEDGNLYNGYAPLYGSMTKAPILDSPPPHKAEFDTLKLKLFEEMIEDCQKRGIKLLFFVSPAYQKSYADAAIPVVNICERKKVTVKIYDYNDVDSLSLMNYYYDSSHLNDAGVKIYTRKIINDIRKVLYN